MTEEGWAKPDRPIKDRSGHARWSHYFIDGKSLCGRWIWSKLSDPEPVLRNEVFSTDCITCRNKLAKMRSEYVDGWSIPDEDSLDFDHYFEDGISLCGRFIQDRDAPDIEFRVTAGMGICQYCSTLRENVKRNDESLNMELLSEPQRRVLEESLTRAQYRVLEMVRNNPRITRTELKDVMDLRPRTITTALRVLRRKNLVKGIPDLTDMRNVNYVAT